MPRYEVGVTVRLYADDMDQAARIVGDKADKLLNDPMICATIDNVVLLPSDGTEK